MEILPGSFMKFHFTWQVHTRLNHASLADSWMADISAITVTFGYTSIQATGRSPQLQCVHWSLSWHSFRSTIHPLSKESLLLKRKTLSIIICANRLVLCIYFCRPLFHAKYHWHELFIHKTSPNQPSRCLLHHQTDRDQRPQGCNPSCHVIRPERSIIYLIVGSSLGKTCGKYRKCVIICEIGNTMTRVVGNVMMGFCLWL